MTKQEADQDHGFFVCSVSVDEQFGLRRSDNGQTVADRLVVMGAWAAKVHNHRPASNHLKAGVTKSEIEYKHQQTYLYPIGIHR